MNVNLDISIPELPEYIIDVGVFTVNNPRKQITKLGINNAELMFIHENGSGVHHIPARPVLEKTISWANSSGLVEKTIEKAYNIILNTGDIKEADKEIEKLCLKLQNYARNVIYDNNGQLAPNAPSTIKKKGENYPLHDTGQLARSITCRFRKL